jgi:hypothetical protein
MGAGSCWAASCCRPGHHVVSSLPDAALLASPEISMPLLTLAPAHSRWRHLLRNIPAAAIAYREGERWPPTGASWRRTVPPLPPAFLATMSTHWLPATWKPVPPFPLDRRQQAWGEGEPPPAVTAEDGRVRSARLGPGEEVGG